MFPDQIACAENLVGEREIPDHPLVRQTIADCLTEAMDIDGLERLLTRHRIGDIRVVARDLTEPSPLALEVLSARPYAYLDDAPLEERRTQAVMSRRWLAPKTAADLGRLDPEAIARVRGEAWPEPANADELHDALVWLGFLTAAEVAAKPGWSDWLAELAQQTRVDAAGSGRRTALDRGRAPAAVPRAVAGCEARAGDRGARGLCGADWSRDEALVEIMRGRLEGLGPVDAGRARRAARPRAAREIARPLAALEAEGFAMRGRFTPGARARNGASGACSRASITTPSSVCAPRSSRSRRATSCASCSIGSA